MQAELNRMLDVLEPDWDPTSVGRRRPSITKRANTPTKCGGGGIRTHGSLATSAVFKTAAFDRSATPPRQSLRGFARDAATRAATIDSNSDSNALQPRAAHSLRIVVKRGPVEQCRTLQDMGPSAACPVGTTPCNDVSSDNLLWLVFPFAVGLAFLFAWPLTRFLPHRPLIGWPLAIIGAVVFVYFYVAGTNSSLWPQGTFIGFFISVIGIGLARGRTTTDPHAA